MKIGNQTLEVASKLIKDLIKNHSVSIDRAYLEAENELTVSISLKFKPVKDSQEVLVDVGLSFIAEKVKDAAQAMVNESQMALFDDLQTGKLKVTVKPRAEELDPPMQPASECGVPPAGNSPDHDEHCQECGHHVTDQSEGGVFCGLPVNEPCQCTVCAVS